MGSASLAEVTYKPNKQPVKPPATSVDNISPDTVLPSFFSSAFHIPYLNSYLSPLAKISNLTSSSSAVYLKCVGVF